MNVETSERALKGAVPIVMPCWKYISMILVEANMNVTTVAPEYFSVIQKMNRTNNFPTGTTVTKKFIYFSLTTRPYVYYSVANEGRESI